MYITQRHISTSEKYVQATLVKSPDVLLPSPRGLHSGLACKVTNLSVTPQTILPITARGSTFSAEVYLLRQLLDLHSEFSHSELLSSSVTG